jgi:uncharacterized protein YgbK (DUF1537 family)
VLIGCIADDLTGATDLAVTLAREGLSVTQVNGVPEAALAVRQSAANLQRASSDSPKSSTGIPSCEHRLRT